MDLSKLNSLIESSTSILIIQADNPDGDSLASSLALEHILEEQGKKVILYCGVEIPSYLKTIQGWDRVVNEVPNNFDFSLVIDCGSISLLETMQKNGQISWIKSKPLIIIDHHTTKPTIDFATDFINQEVSSTGELIHNISKINNWDINVECANLLAISILSDTLGLTTQSVTDKTLLTMSELVKNGANLAQIEENRRKSNKKSIELVKYKAQLLNRIDISIDNRIAIVDIPWKEIEKYSHAYNPSMLVLDEMRMIEGVEVAIAFKTYPDGKITAKIRSNFGFEIAGSLAEHFGGGGHSYAAGFKIQKGNFAEIKLNCINKASELLNDIKS